MKELICCRDSKVNEIRSRPITNYYHEFEKKLNQKCKPYNKALGKRQFIWIWVELQVKLKMTSNIYLEIRQALEQKLKIALMQYRKNNYHLEKSLFYLFWHDIDYRTRLSVLKDNKEKYKSS